MGMESSQEAGYYHNRRPQSWYFTLQRHDENLRNIMWEWTATEMIEDTMKVCVPSFGNGKATELMFTLQKHDESL